MNKRILVVSTLIVAVVGACAKQRPVQQIPDADVERIEKVKFTGLDARSSWLSKVTVVKTSLNGGFAFVGFQSDAKLGHFEVTSNKLRYINDVVPYQQSETIAPEIINEWDITHHDKRLAESDGFVSNREEEDADKHWYEKRFFKIDFSRANITEAAAFPYTLDVAQKHQCWSKQASYVVPGSTKIDTDYITFTVAVDYQQNTLCSEDIRRWNRENFTYTVHYKYSFKRVPSNEGSCLNGSDSGYQPFAYKSEIDPKRKKFGFFETNVDYIRNTPLKAQDGLYQKKILMKRWNPEKEHHYYFAKGTPEQYKAMFADPVNGIFAVTNKLFEKNGLKTRFYIHENTWGDGQEKEFGDIRYSFVKFVEEYDPDAPLGYGPSDGFPCSGEIHAANLVIWTGKLNHYLYRLKRTSDRSIKKWEESSLFSSMLRTLTTMAADEADKEKFAKHQTWANPIDPESDLGKVYFNILPERTFHRPGGRFTTLKEGPEDNAKKFFDVSRLETSTKFMKDSQGLEEVKKAIQKSKKYVEAIANERSQRHVNTSVYPIEQELAQGTTAILIDGKNPKDVIENILYRVSIHEFGHNLGLRHNFYGSIDKPNFKTPTVETDADGKKISYMQMTASVMDYMALEDDIHSEKDWGRYDEAALLFAYSSGKIDSDRTYLFCTDEHQATNALCNKWDRGSSPTEVAMSLIESYESQYHFLNYRDERAYWSTDLYPGTIFGNMWQMKKFLALWESGFTSNEVATFMRKKKFNRFDIDRTRQILKGELTQAVKLTLAFYNAVLQQTDADRPWRDQFDEWTGEVKRIGTMYDKLFASMFLMGDSTFHYDPNKPTYYYTYLSKMDDPELGKLIDQIIENNVTVRVDMYPWFIDLGRSLFASNATNYVNRDDATLIDKIMVREYKAEQMQRIFGIDVTAYTDLVVIEDGLKQSSDPYFTVGDVVGFVKINNKYYMTSKKRNPYAYHIIELMVHQKPLDASMTTIKDDFLDLFHLYKWAVNDKSKD